ncbi:MAG: LysM peptidoglycan-binding domain-containing protein [Bacteroidota bacterium]|nr:LysM peptidoglycan-binding domain-containing protein [Bacteroidota bacterium]
MKLYLSLILIFFLNGLFAQPIEVPNQMYFAGMTLNLSSGLRQELQKQVIEITKNKTYFQAKVNRTDTYFPIIEKAFIEEDIPLDFKYLVIQESSLQSDVVSTSNAVGFWQFKKESGEEVGLLINSEVDERKHILESSRAAARYLKKNYLMTTNWIYALIAYNTGLGGVKPYIESKYVGALEMDVDKDLHWYAIKFLAYKLAYEEKVGYNKSPELSLLEYSKNVKGKSLSEIANETAITEEKLREYNKWLIARKVPEDKEYTIMLPVTYLEREQVAARLGIDLYAKAEKSNETKEPVVAIKSNPQTPSGSNGVPLLVTANNLNAIIARKGDNLAQLAFSGEISIEKFLRYNDMQKFEEVTEGKLYYLESKNNRGITLYHTAAMGETMWDISQKYGIKLKQLLRKNRMEENDALQTGRLIYLKYKRPEDEPIVIASPPVIKQEKASESVKPISVTKEQGVNMNPPIKKDTLKQNPVVPIDNKDSISTQPSNTYSKDTTNTTKTISEKPKPKTVNLKEGLKDSSYVYHVAAMQQTLYAISRYYGTKMDSIRVWNNIGPDGVKFDQLLLVNKSPTVLKSNFNIFIAKTGQDINSLASEIGVSVENILIWNSKKNSTLLAGEIIKIKK